MRKLFIFVILVAPLSVFADNLIFNGGFDMTPWDTGWVASEFGGSMAQVDIDTSKDISPPNACHISTWAMSGANRWGEIVQTIYPPAINCTCRAFLKYDIGVWSGRAEVRLKININNNWRKEWSDMAGGEEDIDSTENWVIWEKVYTTNDTIRGISFSSGSYTSQPDNMAGANLFIEDVYISGEEIGIEENPNIKNQNVKIEIFPNPFVQTTVVSGERSVDSKTKIQVYDISGKLVEETKNNVIGSNLKPGIYFVKVNNYKPVKVVKMSYLK
ncbi:MAG: T9SS type A sorting domain-containing protein [bacterium]|nr:T9SS type A sorting domain-containing protein [bacterium]